jgi:hypothetical protein
MWIVLLLAPGQDPVPLRAFLEKHCTACHEGADAKGGLDLTALRFAPADPKRFAAWVKVHDRLRDGDMPPAGKPRPAREEVDLLLQALAAPLAAADRERADAQGRAVWRRLNRYEYENALRDLLQAPWLQIKEMLPEDGEAHRFNKVGDALDVSHVQMAQYLAAAEHALRAVIADAPERPASTTVRYRTRDMRSFARKMLFNEFNRSPDRATFPVLGFAGQPDVRSQKAPLSDPARVDEESMAVVAGAYEPLEPKFDGFKASRAGRYKIRLCGHSVWVGPGKEPKWWIPDLDVVSKGRRPEPVTLYAESPPHLLRRLGAVDVGVEPTVVELDVHLLAGETIRPDAARLFRSRPPNWRNPLATKEGVPGVAYRWLEVEGPLVDAWPPAGHLLLFGDGGKDVEKLLRAFVAKAYRRPAAEADVRGFVEVARKALARGVPFEEAMIAGASAVLCSPGFVCLEERPGPLDAPALSARLAFFLWNGPPDRPLTEKDVDRLLDDPRARRFADAFVDYWLDLRRINATSPDAALYPDYYLDDLLVESADEEPRAFFREMLARDLPARHVVASDFAMLNERLAAHYGLPAVEGVGLRRVPLPAESPRGGFMTMAGVLKVTANGTTTSPVLRGAWIMERILGLPPPPPPPSVPAVEPDIRGAQTIREQLDKHRTQKACAACHVKIDPAGFALESFDVVGGFRTRYRALGEGARAVGFGKNGQPFEFHDGPAVDASGELPGGGAFKDVVELKGLLLKNERQIARNLASQLIVYATGAPVRFGDRAELEAILDRAAPSGWGLRTLIREIVRSPLFQRK